MSKYDQIDSPIAGYLSAAQPPLGHPNKFPPAPPVEISSLGGKPTAPSHVEVKPWPWGCPLYRWMISFGENPT